MIKGMNHNTNNHAVFRQIKMVSLRGGRTSVLKDALPCTGYREVLAASIIGRGLL